jgi:hypothetical protein
LPLTTVDGADSSFAPLKDDITLARTAYPGWPWIADQREKEQMKKRLEANIKKWGPMFSGSEMMRIALTVTPPGKWYFLSFVP